MRENGDDMGDTFQTMIWTLAYRCPLRDSQELMEPQVVHERLLVPWLYAQAVQKSELLDEDICVINYTWEKRGGQSVWMPGQGFRASEALVPFGGRERLHELCFKCPANALSSLSFPVVGCFGRLSFDIETLHRLDSCLGSILDTQGARKEFEQLFIAVRRGAFFGMWMYSPLSAAQARVLLALLEGLPEIKGLDVDSVQQFMAALRASIGYNIPIHIHRIPMGHVDCGYWSVMPHCPRCKAPTYLSNEQEPPPGKSVNCWVCGFGYVPESEWFRGEQIPFIFRWYHSDKFPRVADLVSEIPESWIRPHDFEWHKR